MPNRTARLHFLISADLSAVELDMAEPAYAGVHEARNAEGATVFGSSLPAHEERVA